MGAPVRGGTPPQRLTLGPVQKNQSTSVILKLIPWDQRMQLDPAIVSREFAAKRQKEVFKRELMTRLASVHVENSGRLFGRNRRICAHFTGRKCTDPLRRRRSGLSQEPPHGEAQAANRAKPECLPPTHSPDTSSIATGFPVAEGSQASWQQAMDASRI